MKGATVELSPKQALELWRAVAVAALQVEHPDLTARQFALLLQVYLAPPPHSVRGLARALAMSKPAVSRALDTLGKLDFLRRKTDEADRRSVLVQRTVKGSVYLRDFGDLAAAAAKGIDRDSAVGP
jgi:DNA-binding MarR family transcriptional regulator